MKKFLLKQAKKSISLFLAVLMVLSCWVWFAPEEAKKAEALAAFTDGYTVSVQYKISSDTFDEGVQIGYKHLGTGWEASDAPSDHIIKYTYATSISEGKNKIGTHTASFSTGSNFPCCIKVWTDDAQGCKCSAAIDIVSISINGKQVFAGASSGDGHSGENAWEAYFDYGGDGTSGTSPGKGKFSWPRPAIAGFINRSEISTASLTLNAYGSAAAKTNVTLPGSIYESSAPNRFEYYNQYEVKMAYDSGKVSTLVGADSKTYISDSLNGSDESELASNIRFVSGAVEADSILGYSAFNGAASKTVYLVKTFVYQTSFGKTTSYASVKIVVNNHPYSITFHSGMAGAKMPVGDEYKEGQYSTEAYHNTEIDYPGDAVLSGSTFLGYFSVAQPESGDAYYYTKEADFAYPATTDEYNEIVRNGGKADGSFVVDKDGKKWYNAGKKFSKDDYGLLNVTGMDTTDDVTDDKYSNNWYAWWLADDLNVKFYDVDGSFIGEKAVKSGQTASAIKFTSEELGGKWTTSNDWPVSKYAKTGYTSGAFEFSVSATDWVNIDGTVINNTSAKFSKDLILTPKLSRTSFTDSYQVIFASPDGGNSSVENYNYREPISTVANNIKNQLPAVPADVANDLQFRYELLGWSSVTPTTGKNYHVVLEDADFDVNGTAINTNSDWIVRESKTYYAVYRRYTKTYLVEFNYTDATGAPAKRPLKVKYGEKLVPPTEYVPSSYVTEGNGYNFASWSYIKKIEGNNATTSTLGYAAEIPFTSANILIEAKNLDGYTGEGAAAIQINAVYGEPVPTPYTVVFKYVDNDGKDLVNTATVFNGSSITEDTVEALAPAEHWENDNKQYTYANEWEITEGAALLDGTLKSVGEIVDTEKLTNLSPKSNLTLKAVYGDPTPYFTVTYIDGAETYTERVLQGSNVPAWLIDNEEYVPEVRNVEGGTEVFQGWYDEKQKDETFKATNGNKITTADTVTGNLTLYSQFKFNPFKYLIEFVDHAGLQLAAWEYEKGQNIEAIVTRATKAAQARTDDAVYDYVFIGWDKPVPTECEGKAVTFVAQYKAVYQYYDAKWYNSRPDYDENGNITRWVADTDDLLNTTKHTYNSKLYTPIIDNIQCKEAAPVGQSFVFDGWYYLKDGVEIKFQRGMSITADMEFYAKYALTNKLYTVTAVIDEKTTKTYTVAAGSAAVIPDPQDGFVDAPLYEKNEDGSFKLDENGKKIKIADSYHNEFDTWYTDADYENEYIVEYDADGNVTVGAITADTTLYAKFVESEHDYTNETITKSPTYYDLGSKDTWCSCDPARIVKEDIPMLVDDTIPTGIIYLNGNGNTYSWSSEDEQGAAATDSQPASIILNSDADIIVTANDTGKGVKLIKAFAFPASVTVDANNFTAARAVAMDVYEAPYEMDGNGVKVYGKEVTANANFAVKLGDAFVADLADDGSVQYNGDGSVKTKKLTSGETYIVYYYVIDKAGNELNRKVRTAKFIYDDEAPVFNIEGDDGSKTVPTFCGSATITGIEAGSIFKVNDIIKFAEENGTYVINYAEGMDNLFITATDAAGNTYSKKIKVRDHAYHVTEVPSTCYAAGYKQEKCLNCDHVKSYKAYPQTDHVMGMPAVYPGDCINNGYQVIKCEYCDYTVTSEYVLDQNGNETDVPVAPAHDHQFDKDADDNIIYTTVTESTCLTKGTAEAYCKACKGALDGGYLTKELDLNPDNHEALVIADVAPDCVLNGYYEETCACSSEPLVRKDHTTDPEIYSATGHDTEWVLAYYTVDGETSIPYEPTCYQPGKMQEQCKNCTTVITPATEFGYTTEENGNFAYVTETVGEGEEATEVKVTEEIDGVINYKYYHLPATNEHVKTLANPDTYKTECVVKYKCATEGCPYAYDDKVLEKDEYYTVTFLKEDGSKIKDVTVLEGTAIAKEAVTAPDKAATVESTYSFAGWVEVITGKDGTVSEGSTYKLPLTPEKDMTLKATYKATQILYTHRFFVPTTWTETLAADASTAVYATLVGGYGEERVPSGTPVFTHKNPDEDARLKSMYTFEFKGWKDSAGNIVTDFTITTDAEFTAYFERNAIEHQVIFISNGKAVGETLLVAHGSSIAADAFPTGLTKDYDDEFHYTFENKWYTDAACTVEYNGAAIEEKTRLYAGFTGIGHTHNIDVPNEDGKEPVNWDATCTEDGQKTTKCSCGDENVTVIPALKHDFTNGEVLAEDKELADGTVIKAGSTLCVRYEDCGAFIAPEVKTYTITFSEKVVNEENAVLSTGAIDSAVVDENGKIEFTAPEKTKTAEYEYKFVNWTDAEGAEISATAKLALEEIANDATYTANYKAIRRVYVVSYFDVDFKTVLKSITVKYGDAIPVGSAPAAPKKESTAHDHYIFKGWDTAEGAKVTGNLEILPIIETQAHNFVETSGSTNATCTEPGGAIYECKGCGETKTSGTSPALGHKYKVEKKTEATYDKEGSIIKKCERCGDTKTETIPKREYKYINVTVKDANGNVVAGAKVELYTGEKFVADGTTGADGKVTFRVGDENYKYKVRISGVDGLEGKEFDVSGGSTIETKPEGSSNNGCSCSCHKAGFWGILFRLLHKFLKLFTGKISCCDSPDPMYK